jgi:carbonic anhydrase/acetyltransferase-like protein (isoleucine patch superfamily)
MNKNSTLNIFVLLTTQIVLVFLGIFIYNKYIIEKPHILGTGFNSFTSQISRPSLDKKTDYIHPTASIIGKTYIGHHVFVAPQASVRGDEGVPIYIGNDSNVQDGVVIHALETEEHGETIERDLKKVNGKRYAVYIGNKVSLAHQSQVHGPAVVGDNTFVGMQSLVFNATIGENCVIEPGAKIIGVSVPAHRYVPAGSVVNQQAQADALPEIVDGYKFKNINKAVVHVNTQLATTYNKLYGY